MHFRWKYYVWSVDYLFQEAASLCINHCILINRTDVLFRWIYQRYSESAAKKAAFIECLEPYILSGKLTRVTSDVMKDFVDHYEKKGSLGIVEACIVNVDIANIDVRQVLCVNLTLFTTCFLLHTQIKCADRWLCVKKPTDSQTHRANKSSCWAE